MDHVHSTPASSWLPAPTCLLLPAAANGKRWLLRLLPPAMPPAGYRHTSTQPRELPPPPHFQYCERKCLSLCDTLVLHPYFFVSAGLENFFLNGFLLGKTLFLQDPDPDPDPEPQHRAVLC
jgi:hypothetical protein